MAHTFGYCGLLLVDLILGSMPLGNSVTALVHHAVLQLQAQILLRVQIQAYSSQICTCCQCTDEASPSCVTGEGLMAKISECLDYDAAKTEGHTHDVSTEPTNASIKLQALSIRFLQVSDDMHRL